MENLPQSKADLEKLITDKIEESFNLEYKGADALQNTDGKKKEIAKDVSSFANSAGGIIIYGIKEFDEPEKRHLPERIIPINRTQISKEWLEQVINSNISPKIEDLKIYPVVLDNIDKVVYLIEIPKSNTAHQNTIDKRYYRRYNFESVPMLDYEIRDIMNRVKDPIIEIGFEIQKVVFKKEKSEQTKYQSSVFNIIQKGIGIEFEYNLKIFPINVGSIYAKYINYFIRIPDNIIDEYAKKRLKRINATTIEYYGENTYRDVVDFKSVPMGGGFSKYGPSRFDPVLPGLQGRSEKLRLIDEPILDDREISWTVYADNALPKTGKIKLNAIPLSEINENDD